MKRSGLLHASEMVEEFTISEYLERYKAKPLHGYYERVCSNVWDQASSFYWLVKGDISIESEGFLMAAQEQSLPTRAMANIYGSSGSSLCQLCGEHPETVEHLISGCSKLAGQMYKCRHDRVLKYLHWLLCKKYLLDCCPQWWCHVPAPVVETDQVKILWDFNIYCDRIINARRLDLTIIDKSKNMVTLVDVSIPADKRILEKEQEKITKYQDLRIELEHLWHKKTRIIPVVIGALGAVSSRFHDFI